MKSQLLRLAVLFVTALQRRCQLNKFETPRPWSFARMGYYRGLDSGTCEAANAVTAPQLEVSALMGYSYACGWLRSRSAVVIIA